MQVARLRSPAIAFSLLLPSAAVFAGGEIAVHGIGNQPFGEFASPRPGNAEQGFGSGFSTTAWKKEHLAYTAEFSLLYNPERGSGNAGTWIHFPVLAGLRWQEDMGPVRGYGQVLGGFAMRSHTDFTGEGGATISADWRPALAGGLGAGFRYRIFHIGARYYYLGQSNHVLEATRGGERLLRTRGYLTEAPMFLVLGGVTFGGSR